MALGEAAYAVPSMAESHNDKAVQSWALGGKYSPDIMKAFTRRCVWDESKSSKFQNHVLNVATVDVLSVIISCKHELSVSGGNIIVYIGLQMVAVIHIGVGSDVVCSTWLGSGRASVRGTKTGRSHAFLSLTEFCLEQSKVTIWKSLITLQ